MAAPCVRSWGQPAAAPRGGAVDEQGSSPTRSASCCVGRCRAVVLVPDLTTLRNDPDAGAAAAADRDGSPAKLIVVEDAVYRPLAGNSAPTLASWHHRGRARGELVQGCLAGPAARFHRGTAALVPALTPGGPRARWPITAAELFTLFGRNGNASTRAVAAQRAEASARQLIARRVLAGFAMVSPDTGLHLCLKLPSGWRSADAERALDTQGVADGTGRSVLVRASRCAGGAATLLGAPTDQPTLERALSLVAVDFSAAPARYTAVV